MAKLIVKDSFASGYDSILRDIVATGTPRPSRLGETMEHINTTYVFKDPFLCVPKREKFSLNFMKAEIALLIAGKYDEELLSKFVPVAGDLIQPTTAYGPRIFEQIDTLIKELRNRHSRRGVVYIGREFDLERTHDPHLSKIDHGEMPCTMTWQFNITMQNKLDMYVNMRSWDMVWGASYDVPSFSAVQIALSLILGVMPGEYVHHAGSAHVYIQRDNIIFPSQVNKVFFPDDGSNRHPRDMDIIMHCSWLVQSNLADLRDAAEAEIIRLHNLRNDDA